MKLPDVVRPRTHRVALAVFALTVQAQAQTATRPGEAPGTRPADGPPDLASPTTQPALFPPDARDRIPLYSTTPIKQRFKDIVAVAERWDPRSDGDYPAETLSFLAERRLAALAERLIAGADAAEAGVASAPVIAEGAQAAPLRPVDLVTIVEEPPLAVRWPEKATRTIPGGSAGGSQARRIEAARALREFLAPFADDARQIEFAIVRISGPEVRGDELCFETTALVTAWGGGREGGLRQQNATWRIEWRSPPPPPAAERGSNSDAGWDRVERGMRIASIAPLDYEEVADGGPRFVDCTESVLSDAPRLREIIARDTNHWYRVLDRLAGVDLLGHTGLAVGDVNGDGLDDVYLAQPGGLPNALLLQQPDGTLLDAAAAANVDFLDMTRAALLVDADNDGDRDLVLSLRNATVMLENDGAGVFSPGTPPLDAQTVNMPAQFFSIAAADYDRDAFLDLYSVRYVRGAYGVDVPVPLFDAGNGPPNHLISIRRSSGGEWEFAERTAEVGLDDNNRRFSLAASWEDFDDDGDPDLYVANDFGRANLYVNDLGRFRDEATLRGAENQAAGMGVTWGDFDRDGVMDLYVSNMFSPAGMRVMSRSDFRPDDPPEVRRHLLSQVMGNALFRGDGKGRFEQRRAADGAYGDDALRVGIEGWSWGALFVDINNDGWPDLLVPNGNFTNPRAEDLDSLFWRRVASESPTTMTMPPAYANAWSAMSLLMLREFSWAGRQRHATYLNLRNGCFADVSCISGFGLRDDGRALAVSDWDGDGDVDVWIKNRTAPALRFLRNETRRPRGPANPPATTHAAPGGSEGRDAIDGGGREAAADLSGSAHRFLQLELVGTTSNRDAIGARVTVETAGFRQMATVRAGEGYLAQSSHTLHFGLGRADRIDRVALRWPDGRSEVVSGLEPDRRYRIVQSPMSAADGAYPVAPAGEPAARVEAIPLRDPAALRIAASPPRRLHEAPTGARDESSPPADGPASGRTPAPGGDVRPVEHVVLWDPLALPDLTLSTDDGRQLRTEQLLGHPYALLLWSSRGPENARAVRVLVDAAAQIAEINLVLVLVCVDGPERSDRGEAVLREIDPQLVHLRSTSALLDLVDVAQQEVLGRPEDLILPTLWTVDRNGLLVSMQRGGVDAGRLVVDAQRDARVPHPYPGRLLHPQSRLYGFVGDELRKRGHAEMAEFYRGVQRRMIEVQRGINLPRPRRAPAP